MLRQTLRAADGATVVVMDSMSQVEEGDRGAVVIAASNAGRESGRIAVLAGCAFVVLNDAGIGKQEAGVAGLELAADAGLPMAAVDHRSAEISNGIDTWLNGSISRVNSPAARAGVTPGMSTQAAVAAITSEGTWS